MKTFRYHIALLIVVLTAIATNVQAQDDERALGAAADTIIRTETRDYIVNRIVENVYQSHPTASLATRLAKAYYNYNENSETKERMFHKNDTAHAFLFIKRALELDPKYAPAYVLASDILNYAGQRDVAMQWLDNGIAQNPTDSSLYIASALLLAYTDSEAAIAKLKVLKEKDPNFPVDLQLGRLYYELYNHHGQLPMNEMAIHFGKAYDGGDKERMTVGDLAAYANSLQWADQVSDRFNKAYDVCTYGIGKFPKDVGLRKFFFYSCWATSKWEEGITAAQNLFSLDSTKVGVIDYLRYGMCLKGAKRYDEAIAQYEKIIGMDDATERNRTDAENNIAAAITAQVDEVRKAGDYQKALAIIKPYVEKYKAMGKQNDNLMINYGFIYVTWSADLKDEEKKNSLLTAIKIFEDASANSELNKYMFLRQCVYYSFAVDPDLKDGIGMPFARKLIDDLGSKSNLDSDDKRNLIIGYEYMMRYEYFVNNRNKKGAIAWGEKMLDLDPSNQTALQFITVLSK